MACSQQQLACAKGMDYQLQLKDPAQKGKSSKQSQCKSQRRSSGFTPYLMSWLQLALAAMFFSEAFVYSIIEPYLPQALSHAPSIYLSVTFGAYSISQLAGTVLLVLLQILPTVAAIGPKNDYFIATAAFSIYAVTGCLATIEPSSIAIMLLQRVLLGLSAAVFSVHAYKGVARALSPQDALKAIACINAGLVAGDSVAPIVGDLVYRLAGVRGVNGLQPLVCAAAALLIVTLPASLAVRTRWREWLRQKQKQKQWADNAMVNNAYESDQQQHLADGAVKPVGMIGQAQEQVTSSKPKCDDVHVGMTKLRLVDVATAEQQPGFFAVLNAATSNSTTATDRTKLLCKCLCNVSLTAQLSVLVLTQFASSLSSILIPEALQGEPLWMVPALFAVQVGSLVSYLWNISLANYSNFALNVHGATGRVAECMASVWWLAVCSIIGPFIMDAALSKWPKVNTALLMAIMATALAAASGTMLPAAAASMFAALFICCAVAGATYSTLEVLVFHHATQITAATGCNVAADMGAILYTLFYCAGNTLGGMVGGAAADVSGQLQIHIAEGVSGLILVYAVVLFLMTHLSRRKLNAQALPE